MARTMAPQNATEDGWPYPDTGAEPLADEDIDLDALDLRADPHAYQSLSPSEREILFQRFGLGGRSPCSMKDIAHLHQLTHAEARDLLGRAIDKMRSHLAEQDGGPSV